MSRFAKSFALLLLFAGLLLGATNANAAACVSAISGNWNAAATWTAGSACTIAGGNATDGPGADDTVTIASGHTVTVTAAAASNTLTIAVAAASNGLTISGANSLAVTGLISMARPNAGFTTTIAVGAGTLSAGSLTMLATTLVRPDTISISTGTVTISGAITTGTTGCIFTFTDAGTMNIGGSFSSTPTLTTFAGSTVNYYAAGAQTARAATYSNLTLSGSGIKTFATTPTVNGVLSLEGTATVVATAGVVTYGAAATLQYNTATARTATAEEWITPFAATGGVIIANTGAITLNAAKVFNASVPLTINSGATLATNNLQLTFGGNFVNSGGTFTAGSSPIVIANTMVAQSIAGFTTTGLVSMTKTAGVATFTGNVNGAGLTINGLGGTLNLGTGLTHTFTGAWTTSTGTLNGGSSTLNVGSNCSAPPPVATFTANTGTVNWNAAGAQTVCQYAYNNLILSNSGAKTMTGVTAIGGNLSISGSATMTSNAAFIVTGALNYSSTGTTTLTAATPISIGSFNQTAGTITAGANIITVSGNWNETGTFTSTGIVTLSGVAVQTISGTSPVAFNNLTVTNAANPNITLATNVTVAGTLTGTVTLTPSCPDFTLTSTTPAQVLHTCTTVISINRANPDPTSAATVSWTVTFSRSVTGVDATAFSLVPSGGVSGTFITTVTGSGTTWTVTANTGIGAGTLGLNQTGPGSVVPTLNGTFTGQVYTITATPALAEYRMDEASWNGAANEVVDSSGSGNNAQSFNSASTDGTTPAIAGSPGTCRYGVFDNGGTITQGYVQTPLPDLTSDFTISAWIRTTDNTVANQRILIDDQNNTGGYGLSLADGGTGKLRFYSRGITPANLDSTYTIANNTWYFVAAVADITNKMRTIYVFNSSGTLLNSTTEAAWTGGAWGTDAGPVSIGAETNASGQAPASFHFRGNLDEVRVYQKVLNQNALAAIAAQTHVCPVAAPDHIQLEHTGSGLTCQPSIITVKACADAACSSLYSGSVTATLSTTAGTWASNPITFTGSTSVNLSVLQPQTVTIGTSSVLPVPASSTICLVGATPNCDIVFADTGFILSSFPNQVAGVASGNLTIQAVKKAGNSPNCVNVFQNKTVAIDMASQCIDPITCIAGNQIAITPASPVATTLIANNPASGIATYTPVTMDFNNTSTATFTLNYPDVGKMSLTARYALGGGNYMTGTSNNFVVAPHHFNFSGITAGLIKAGNNFSATVTAYNGLATPTATPNFGKESVAEGVTLTSNLVSPAGGNNPGIGNNAIPGSEFGAGGMVSDADGVAMVNNLNWGDVGLITLTANLTSGSYLGSALTATGTSANVGRFIPDHFDTVTSGGMPCPTGLTCPTQFNGFVYSGQPFTTQVTALNLAGGTTLNYDSARGYSKAVTLSAWDADGGAAANPGGGTLNPNTVPSTAFNLGMATTSTPIYTFPTTPVAPTDIYIRAAESFGGDGVTSLRGVSSVEGGIKVVSGRLKISNAHGSELLPLPMTATVQYWNNTNWVTSTTDNATSFNTATDIVASIVKGPLAGVSVASAGVVTVVGGVKTFTLNKPLVTGSADISLSAPGYLLAGSNVAAVNPSKAGRATFGVYKGNKEFIYLRENY